MGTWGTKYRCPLSFIAFAAFSLSLGAASPPAKAAADSPTSAQKAPTDAEPKPEQKKKKPAWELKRQQNGVRIYLRKTGDSPVLQVRAVKKMKTSLSALVALIKDSRGRQRWIYRNKTAKTLEARGDFEWINYKEMDAPWPVSNRDMIVHSKLTQDPKTYAIRMDAIGLPAFLPEKKGVVRVPKIITSWKFVPQKDGMVEVSFELAIELGGKLPAWLVNTSIDRGPYETILGMARFVKKRRYRNAKIPYIKEMPVE
jgi:hypothetical protein